MPLSEPVERELLHLRDIAVRGYRRADGLFDIEAEIADTKTYGFAVGARRVEPGDKLHNMLVRMTVDETLTIVACEAATEYGPFETCGGGASTFPPVGDMGGLGLTLQRGLPRPSSTTPDTTKPKGGQECSGRISTLWRTGCATGGDGAPKISAEP